MTTGDGSGGQTIDSSIPLLEPSIRTPSNGKRACRFRGCHGAVQQVRGIEERTRGRQGQPQGNRSPDHATQVTLAGLLI